MKTQKKEKGTMIPINRESTKTITPNVRQDFSVQPVLAQLESIKKTIFSYVNSHEVKKKLKIQIP